jgi:transposase InsO family protein
MTDCGATDTITTVTDSPPPQPPPIDDLDVLEQLAEGARLQDSIFENSVNESSFLDTEAEANSQSCSCFAIWTPPPSAIKDQTFDESSIDDALKNVKNSTVKARMKQVLLKSIHVVSTNSFDVGLIPNAEFPIDTVEGAQPFATKAFRQNAKHAKEMENQVKIWLDSGFCRESNSNWAAGSFLVPKADGRWRFVVDYRQLNKRTIKMRAPLPRIDDILKTFKGCKVFSCLDMRQGYFHVKIRESDIEKTAFVTPRGQYEMLRMNFGYSNAPPFFQQLMERLLKGIEGVTVYLDDILIATKDEKSHQKALSRVIEVFSRNNMKLNLSKCLLFQRDLKYLGHIISDQGVAANPEYIKKILSLRRPRTRKEVQRFLGAVNWLSKFIPNLASYTARLNKLKRKEGKSGKYITKVEWNSDLENDFNAIHELVANTEILSHPDLDKQFIVRTDASDVALGAVLLQEHKGELKPIEFLSKQFDDTQKNWHASDKELFGCIYAIKRWRHYLISAPFLLDTDHKNLCKLFNEPSTRGESRKERWAATLMEYQFVASHIRGVDNVIADFLSRDGAQLLHIPPKPYASTKQKIAKSEQLMQLIHLVDTVKPSQSKLNNTDTGNVFGITHFAMHGTADNCPNAPTGHTGANTDVSMSDRKMHSGSDGTLPLYSLAREPRSGLTTPRAQPHRDEVQSSQECEHKCFLMRGPVARLVTRSEDYMRQLPIKDVCFESNGACVKPKHRVFTSKRCEQRKSAQREAEATETVYVMSTKCNPELRLDQAEYWVRWRQQKDQKPCSTERGIGTMQQRVPKRVRSCMDIDISEPNDGALAGGSNPSTFVVTRSQTKALREKKAREKESATKPTADEATNTSRKKKSKKKKVSPSAPKTKRRKTNPSKAPKRRREPIRYESDHSEESDDEHNANVSGAQIYRDEINNAFKSISFEGEELGDIFEPKKFREMLEKDTLYTAAVAAIGGDHSKLQSSTKGGENDYYTLISDIAQKRLTIETESRSLFYEDRLYVPAELRPRLLRSFHSHVLNFHQGASAMYANMKRQFYWPKLKDNIRNFVAMCDICSVVKKGRHEATGIIQRYYATEPFQILHMDLVGELPCTVRGNKYVLTLMDRFSHFVIAVPIPDKTANTVMRALLNHWIFVFGRPQKIVTDNGSEFKNSTMRQMCTQLSIEHRFTSTYHPQCNGQLERWHRYFKQQLALHAYNLFKSIKRERSKFLNTSKWDEFVSSICAAYNSTPIEAFKLKLTPYEIIFGHNMPTPFSKVTQELGMTRTWLGGSDVEDWVTNLAQNLKSVKAGAAVLQEIYNKQRDKYHNAKRYPSPWAIGDHVFLFVGDQKAELGHKLTPNYTGPWRIMDYNNMVNVRIQNCKDTTLVKNVHVGKLKRAIPELTPKSVPSKVDKQILTDSQRRFETDLAALKSYAGQCKYTEEARTRDADPTTWHRTPPVLAEWFASQIRPTDAIICDLFAGGGEITQHLAMSTQLPTASQDSKRRRFSKIYALERNPHRVRMGRKVCSKAKWFCADLFTRGGLKTLDTLPKADLVVSNPPFKHVAAALFLALRVLTKKSHGRIVMLLPKTTFDPPSSKKQQKTREIFESLGFKITHEYGAGQGHEQASRIRRLNIRVN